MTAALLFGTGANATGLYSCEATKQSDWLSSDALTEKLEGEGWVVRRMKVDGGCWEVYGTDPEGASRRGLLSSRDWRREADRATWNYPVSG